MTVGRIAFMTAVNNESVLRGNLLRSPCISSGATPLIIEQGHASASKAYNAAIRKTDADILICVHQDIYLPDGWAERLLHQIRTLEDAGEPWGVLGVWGIDNQEEFHGRVWCSGGGMEHIGGAVPAEVVSIDEVVIVLNRFAGIWFDDELPGFHLYATDIALSAVAVGFKTFVIDAPVIHNSRVNPQVLNSDYFAAYRYMQHKWRTRLPIPTCIVPVTKMGWPLYKKWFRNEIKKRCKHYPDQARHLDPEHLARELGYLTACEDE